MPSRTARGLLAVLAFTTAYGIASKWWKSKLRPISLTKAESYSPKKPPGDDVPIEPHEPPQRGWHPEESEHHRIERRYWRLTAFLTFVAAAGAVATVVLSIRSYREAVKATIEAKRQADIAQDGNRAVVMVNSLHWRNPLQRDNSNQISLDYSNVGRSSTAPRINADVVFNTDSFLKFEGNAISFGENLYCKNIPENEPAIASFPNTSFVLHRYYDVSASRINDILDDKIAVGLMGCIFYEDNGKTYKTGFCIVAAKGDKTANQNESPFCPTGNFTE